MQVLVIITKRVNRSCKEERKTIFANERKGDDGFAGLHDDNLTTNDCASAGHADTSTRCVKGKASSSVPITF